MLLQYTYINYTVNVIVKLNSFDIQKFVNTQFKMLWNYIQKKKKKSTTSDVHRSRLKNIKIILTVF